MAQEDVSKVYRLIKPILFRLDPEDAHYIVSKIMKAVVSGPIQQSISKHYTVIDKRLETTVFGVRFPNPVGLAAGFDKNGEMISELSSLGFGHIEVGSVTRLPQTGNDRKRLFRLEEDDAIINKMGFNNNGAENVAIRLAKTEPLGTPIGINIGMGKEADIQDAPREYAKTFELLIDHGDYFVVNVSCPNIEGIRDLQAGENLAQILNNLNGVDKPILVKIAPDMGNEEIEDIINVAESMKVRGIIATNTRSTDSVEKGELKSSNASKPGGLSGKPIREESTEKIRFIAERTYLPIIGVGGVSSSEDAYEKIRAGASIVQLYTGLIYQGPSVAREINRGLLRLIEKDGYSSIEDAVGADLEQNVRSSIKREKEDISDVRLYADD